MDTLKDAYDFMDHIKNDREFLKLTSKDDYCVLDDLVELSSLDLTKKPVEGNVLYQPYYLTSGNTKIFLDFYHTDPEVIKFVLFKISRFLGSDLVLGMTKRFVS